MDEKTLAEYSFIDCRDMRHAWQSVGDTVLLEKQGRVKVFSRNLQCMRCETLRTDTYQLAGHLVQRIGAHYTYPNQYQVKGGLDVEELRWAKFKNVTMVPVQEVE